MTHRMGSLTGLRQSAVALFGGPARARIVLMLAAVLGLNGADTATISAVTSNLERAFHIGNTKSGCYCPLSRWPGRCAPCRSGSSPTGRSWCFPTGRSWCCPWPLWAACAGLRRGDERHGGSAARSQRGHSAVAGPPWRIAEVLFCAAATTVWPERRGPPAEDVGRCRGLFGLLGGESGSAVNLVADDYSLRKAFLVLYPVAGSALLPEDGAISKHRRPIS